MDLIKDKIKKYVGILVSFTLLFFLALFYINQGIYFPIKGKNLEKTFLKDMEKRHSFQNGKVIDKENYKNSVTLYYQGENGNLAVATYIKSFYNDSWKEVWSMTGNQNMEGEEFNLAVNDHIYSYAVTYRIEQGRFYTEFVEVTKPEALLSRMFHFVMVIIGSSIGVGLGKLIEKWIEKK